MTGVDVRCTRDDRGWTCDVRIREGDREPTRHAVRVEAPDLARLAPREADPTALVERSFAFLLEREAPGSILPSFDLREITRYFPEYDREIRRQIADD